ncbi:hypothetical protein [Streptomyces sp. NPDC048340]|uniref:hypothetical protein n=1 Tax=Streptomyces sp. NPDC048340 TaxID=3365537 RepID=UPI0037136929
MRAAEHLVQRAERSVQKKTDQVTPADVLALVFGEYRMRATDLEAAECLAAALVERGYRAEHLALTVTLHLEPGPLAGSEQPGGAR